MVIASLRKLHFCFRLTVVKIYDWSVYPVEVYAARCYLLMLFALCFALTNFRPSVLYTKEADCHFFKIIGRFARKLTSENHRQVLLSDKCSYF